MDKTQVRELIQRYNEGSASKEEVKLLENWYVHESALQQVDPEEADYLRLNLEIWLNIQEAKGQKKTLSLWPRIAVAASILLCIGIGFYYYQHNRVSVIPDQAVVKDFAPGKSGATLTLANGKRIVLTEADDGTIANQAGVQVRKTADGKLVYLGSGGEEITTPVMNTLATARAEQYQVILPDGSKVWLNAESSLKFPASFKSLANRRVELKGEAYFEVSKDRKRPFIVSTNGQNVEVLGTHFDVSSYADEDATRTTLLEGSVRVSAISVNQTTVEAVLKPNQQSVLRKGSQTLQLGTVNPESVVAWKNGLFQFDNADVKTVMRQLSRWYDIDVEFSGAIPKETFSGKVYRNMSLSKVLEVLSFSQINFKIQGRKMIIHPGENK